MKQQALEKITPLPVEQIFITHYHEDHNGNLEDFQAHFNCPSYASPTCVEIMKKPPRISIPQQLTWGNRPPNTALIPKEGVLETDNHAFEIIPIPGHSIDMMGLYERSQGWFFSADLWVSEYIRYFLYSESMQTQIESIRSVLSLEFDVMLCGHNPQLENVKQKLANKLQFLEDFYGKVAALYHTGRSPASIMKHMGLKEDWKLRIISMGHLSTINMVRAVIQDEKNRVASL